MQNQDKNVKRKLLILSIIVFGLYLAYIAIEKSLVLVALVIFGVLAGIFVAKKMFKTEKEKLLLEEKLLNKIKEKNIKIIKKKKVIDNADYILKTLNCDDTDNIKNIGDFKKSYMRIQRYGPEGLQIHFKGEYVFNYKKVIYSHHSSYIKHSPATLKPDGDGGYILNEGFSEFTSWDNTNEVIEVCKPGEWMEILNRLKKIIEKHEKTKKYDDEINKIRENVNQLKNNI